MGSVSPPAAAADEPATLAKMPVSKLKALARFHGVNIAGCLEKSEMVAALEKFGIDAPAAGKVGPQGNGESVPQDTRTEQEKENERKAKEFAQKKTAVRLREAE